MVGPVDIGAVRMMISDIGHRRLTPHHLSCRHYGVDDRLITCAAANITVLIEPVAHFLTCRFRVVLQQRFSRH
ncbi:hypothetical protein SDC9_182574 [bioreactor metagenome]|uniref:Uncharacterized protein n=1 Tax=bioreactor metagenome TaxID=1076179 RepID=A0A645H8R0_9ZZZZ